MTEKILPGAHFCTGCGTSFVDADGKDLGVADTTLHWDWIVKGKKMKYVLTFKCKSCGYSNTSERIPSRKEQKEIIKMKKEGGKLE